MSDCEQGIMDNLPTHNELEILNLRARIAELEAERETLKCCGNCRVYFDAMHTPEVENPDLFLCPVKDKLKYPHEKCGEWEGRKCK